MRELIKKILREELLYEMPKKITTQEFINRANNVHDNKYDYSLTDYKNSSEKVKIICPIHGVFVQTPNDHIHSKSGCPKCGGVDKIDTNEFIKRSKEIHGDKYDYSFTNYTNNKTPLTITCPIHGDFKQTPSNHYRYGCKKCADIESGLKRKYTKEEFIALANKKYDNKYDYSKVNYENSKKKIDIGCPIHGFFSQMPYHHLQASVGCPKCSDELNANNQRKPQDDFINDANIVHNFKYDYSNVNYVSTNKKVFIICPKHGGFKQSPKSHLKGQGCPVCNESQGEKLIDSILRKLNTPYERQKKFQDCKGIKNIKCRVLPFDFYLTSFNVLIEYDGRQHFEPVSAFGGEEAFQKIKQNDSIKNEYCRKNNIKIIRIPYTMDNSDVEPFIKKELGVPS